MTAENKQHKTDSAVFTFGRFNPITTGHKKLVDAVINHAHEHKADHFIFASHTQDAKKNPLTHHAKIGFMKKMMPHANIDNSAHIKTVFDAVKHLSKKYKKVTMLVGSDRQQEFHNLLHKYNGKDYHVGHLEVRSAGHRDPDSESVEGMSASKMRLHAQNKNFAAFAHGVPKKEHAKDLYHAVRKGMKLESIQRQNKAIFLVGGPGSGKDIILSAVLENTGLIELPLEKIFEAISKRTDLVELHDNPSLVVNGTAESGAKINLTKKVLEAMGYSTAMVYVHTTNEESRARNEQRINQGAKTITEAVRQQKYASAHLYMHQYAKAFETFYIFDNSSDIRNVTEECKDEILHWIVELSEGISLFLSGKDINKLFETSYEKNMSKVGFKVAHATPAVSASKTPHPVPKGMKRIKDGSFNKLVDVDDHRYKNHPVAENISSTAVDVSQGAVGGGASNSYTENDANIIQKKKVLSHKPLLGNKYVDSGTARSDTNSSFGTKVEALGVIKQIADKEVVPQVASKTHNTKKITKAPPDFFDGRLGAVPSGGVGLVSSSYIPKGKSLSELRRNISNIISNVDEE